MEKFIAELTKKAEAGDTNAMFKLGMFYYNGHCFEQSYEKAAEYFCKSAELGNIEAMSYLEWCYDRGYVSEKSREKALELIRRPGAKLLCEK